MDPLDYMNSLQPSDFDEKLVERKESAVTLCVRHPAKNCTSWLARYFPMEPIRGPQNSRNSLKNAGRNPRFEVKRLMALCSFTIRKPIAESGISMSVSYRLLDCLGHPSFA